MTSRGIRENALTEDEKKRINAFLDTADEVAEQAKNLDAYRESLDKQIQDLTEKCEKAEAEGKAFKDDLDALESGARPEGHADRRRGRFLEAGRRVQDAHEVGSAPRCHLVRREGVDCALDVDTSGGFLVPTQMENNIIKEIVEIDPVRAQARVVTIGAKAVEMAVRTTIPRGFYEGEAELAKEAISGYRLVTATPHRQSVIIPTTMDMLMNSAFDMEAQLIGDAGEGFAEGEGINFMVGPGEKTPQGITQNPTIVSGAVGGTIDPVASPTNFATQVIQLTGELKVGYNAMYALHRRTLAYLRTLARFERPVPLAAGDERCRCPTRSTVIPTSSAPRSRRTIRRAGTSWSSEISVAGTRSSIEPASESSETRSPMAGQAIVKFTLHPLEYRGS